MDIKELHRIFLESSGVSTDTRKIRENCIFFALKGDNFNGNDFAESALEKGASWAVTDERTSEVNSRFITVDNVLKCLQDLANFHRSHLGIPVISITGSNGKTTTKELIRAVLSEKFNCKATEGNLNNHIGVPLTLLLMNRETEIAIVEMGANHPGEIGFLCDIVQPDYGYITNFGKAHLEGFGSLEGVIAAKSELYHHLKENGKMLFLNLDDPIQKNQKDSSKNFSFGSPEEADIKISYPTGEIFAGIMIEDTVIKSRLIGSYNALNIAAAYSIGQFFKVPYEKIKSAIENYCPIGNRSQILEKNTNQIILDAYNANPTSMSAALDNLENLDGKIKIAVLGDMFEIGESSQEEHQTLIDRLENSDIEKAVVIGENFYRTTAGEKVIKYKSFEDFRKEMPLHEVSESIILIKGSRGMALERVMDLL